MFACLTDSGLSWLEWGLRGGFGAIATVFATKQVSFAKTWSNSIEFMLYMLVSHWICRTLFEFAGLVAPTGPKSRQMALRFNRVCFFLTFRCPLCLWPPHPEPQQEFPPNPPLTLHTLAHPSSLFSCCFATTCAIRCELSEEISADQRSYHPNPNFLAHFGLVQGGSGPTPWPAAVRLLRGFDLWNPPHDPKGWPVDFSLPASVSLGKMSGHTLVGDARGFFWAPFWVPSSGCLFHQLRHKLLGVGQANMGLTGGSPEYPTIPSKTENKTSDCITFGWTCAQHNAPGALNRIIGQECAYKNGSGIKRETQNFKTKFVGPTNLPRPWWCEACIELGAKLTSKTTSPSLRVAKQYFFKVQVSKAQACWPCLQVCMQERGVSGLGESSAFRLHRTGWGGGGGEEHYAGIHAYIFHGARTHTRMYMCTYILPKHARTHAEAHARTHVHTHTHTHTHTHGNTDTQTQTHAHRHTHTQTHTHTHMYIYSHIACGCNWCRVFGLFFFLHWSIWEEGMWEVTTEW